MTDSHESVDIVKAVSECQFLTGAGDALVRPIAAISKVIHQPRGTTVFNEGDACRGMFIVHSGAVKILKTGMDGREHVLHVVMAGDCFGEAAMFLGTGYPAEAQAVKDSILILVRKEQFLGLLSREPELCFQMMAAMATWAHRLVAKVEVLTLKDASARLAEYLLGLAPLLAGRRDGEADVQLAVPKNVLAAQLGMSNETLSRLLTRFEAQRLIVSQGRTITLLDRREMEDLARFGAA
ncbi:MAG: Crp/Fnr family transcriptional regulator [Armatimonadota bacterium]|nr:Crp/Fnr family transcriptional regulator [Armatimonadota bacterium]